jgi:hypothetical protein
MCLYQVTVHKDQDWLTTDELFKLDFLHYVDLNGHMQPHLLTYADHLRRCDNTSRMLGFIDEMIKKYQVTIRSPTDYPHFEKLVRKIAKNMKKAPHQIYSEVEKEV